MGSRIKRAALAVVAAILMATTLLPTNVFAAGLDLGSSKNEDVYDELYAAMRVNVLGNTLRKCIGSLLEGAKGADSANAKSGNIFYRDIFGLNNGFDQTDVSTALWVENVTQGATGNDMDGVIWCYQENGRNVLQQFVNQINSMGGGGSVNIGNDLVCNGENPGLMKRTDGAQCNDFDKGTWDLPVIGQIDAPFNGNMYVKSDNAEGYFRDFYTNWYNERVGENKYLPSYDQLGSFDNVVGYFSYIDDFDKRCASSAELHDINNRQGDDKAIAKFDINRSENKLTIKNQYYHLNDNPTWDGALSVDNPVRSCSGILDRVGALQSFGNGIDSRDSGYEDILLSELHDSCRTAIIDNREDLRQRLQGYIDNGTDEEKADAQAQLDAMNAALDGNGDYVKTSGNRDSEEGEIHQCVVDVDLNVYAAGTLIEGANCANSGGANALGWIVCPIIEWLGDSAEGVYNDYVEPSLKIEPQLFTGGNEAVRTAWGWFQGIANVLFVILLLAVIFSQLTGFGIDNYGIKKILPRLIVMAILTNLSYLLCLICVDLSNILGNGFQAMFENMKQGLPSPSLTVEDSNASLGEGAMTGLTGVAVLAALVGMVGMIWANPMVVLSLFVSALGVVISIFFLFILLAAREAAIIALTVLAPIAVVLYVLPNTKPIFDKWWKFFLGLLMVYPIAGLLVGGGDYISNLLLSAGMGQGGFFAALTAMVVGVMPIFLIPTVLRNSFTMLGNLGAKLQGIGQKTGGWTTGKIRNSGAYQNLQAASNMRKARVFGGDPERAKLDDKGRPLDAGTRARRIIGNVMSGGTRGRQRSALQYRKMVEEEGSLKAVDGTDFMLATQTANATKELTATGAINDIGGLQSSLEKALKENDRAMIRAITDALSAKGESGREAVNAAWNSVARSGGMSSTAASTFANNIMMNHAADYKNNNRSMYEVAKGINGGGSAQTTGDYLAANGAYLAGKATSSTMGNMDDNEFDAVFGGGIPAGSDANSIGATAYAALHDQNANISAERQAKLQKLVDDSGYTPEILDVREAGIVADSQGNEYRVHRNINGGVSDEGGFEVQSDRFNAR